MTRIERQSEVFARTNRKEATALSYPGPQVEIDQELIDVLEGNPKREKNAPRSLAELTDRTTTFHTHSGHDHKHNDHASHYPKYSFDNPPKKFGSARRAGYAVIGTIASVLAGTAWAADSLLHFIGVPHGPILHPLLAAASAPAIIWLNNAWRGYSVTGKGFIRSMKDTWNSVRKAGHSHEGPHYDGNGYPISGTTYAQENLNGHYSQSRTSRGISHVVVNFLAPLAHRIEGYAHAASKEAQRIWKLPLHPAWIFSVPARLLAMVAGGIRMGWKEGLADGKNSYERDLKAAAPRKK